MELICISSSWRMLLLLLLCFSHIHRALGSNVGVAYGRNGNNLPPPSQVVALLKSNNVGKVRIYDTNKEVLEAFQNSGISLIVGAENQELASLASAAAASDWVTNNIVPYASPSKIRCISVGNEVLTQAPQYTQYLFPAMTNVYNALKENNLHNAIYVSTTHAMDVIDSAHSYPPSSGAFSSSVQAQMTSILPFLSQIGSPFLANVYPYFSYAWGGGQIPLSYALFEPGTDNIDKGLHYTNLFDAQVDTLIAAMASMGHNDIPIVITETGWPHEGDSAATINNAKIFNNNLVAHVAVGTPKRPNAVLSTYIFALFDENLKSPPGVEQHFGIFYPNQGKVYDFTFSLNEFIDDM
eukprot:c6956_g1_i1 orf=28-1086(+)